MTEVTALLLLTLLFSVIIYMVTNVAVIIVCHPVSSCFKDLDMIYAPLGVLFIVL